jgi:hypothetical protein
MRWHIRLNPMMERSARPGRRPLQVPRNPPSLAPHGPARTVKGDDERDKPLGETVGETS